MLLNVSYNNKKTKQRIDNEVGKSFLLKERLKMGGIGSPRLTITAANIEIQNLLHLDNNASYCNIEIRPKGIILGFRSLLESYALIIPFYKLTIYKENAFTYSIHRDHYFVKVKADKNDARKFFKKLVDFKTDNTPTSISDL